MSSSFIQKYLLQFWKLDWTMTSVHSSPSFVRGKWRKRSAHVLHWHLPMIRGPHYKYHNSKMHILQLSQLLFVKCLEVNVIINREQNVCCIINSVFAHTAVRQCSAQHGTQRYHQKTATQEADHYYRKRKHPTNPYNSHTITIQYPNNILLQYIHIIFPYIRPIQ